MRQTLSPTLQSINPWKSGPGNLALEIWPWKSGPGNLALEIWPWKSGPGNLALEIWPWKSGPGNLALEIWPWKSGPGNLALEIWVSSLCRFGLRTSKMEITPGKQPQANNHWRENRAWFQLGVQ